MENPVCSFRPGFLLTVSGSDQVTHDGYVVFASFASRKPLRHSACAARRQMENPDLFIQVGVFFRLAPGVCPLRGKGHNRS